MSKPNEHFNNMAISCSTHELVDTLFEELKDLYLAESGMKEEYDSERTIEIFLDSFSFDEKVKHLLTNNFKLY